MALKDTEWPVYTQWYCCPGCRRLWTYQEKDMVALDARLALGPASPSESVPARVCLACTGESASLVAEL